MDASERKGAMVTPKLHALILAGGSGTRFWPWSRRGNPKQFLAIDGQQSLIANTCDRLENWIAPERRWVLTRADLVEAVASQLPDLAHEQILGEPEGRDTAPALALGALRVAIEDPDALLLILPSDHHISDPEAFRRTVERARAALLEDDGLYTFGVTPTEPSTGFGYIERGDPTGAEGCFSVRGFLEKPDRERAEDFLASGEHLWNAGIFLWRASTFLEELSRAAADFTDGLLKLRDALMTGDSPAVARAFELLPKISIDYALLEKSDRVRVVEAAFPWDDVGTWDAVERLRTDRADEAGNVLDPGAIAIESRTSVVIGAGERIAAERVSGVRNRAIVLFGVEDLLVVETDDALLVCPRNRAQEIRRVVDALKSVGREDLL